MARPRLYKTRAEKDAAYYLRKKTRREKLAPLPPGPYRVLYADPPWKYESTDPYFHGHASSHYATMTIEEICAVPVRKIVAPKAVLLLWVPSPQLDESFKVVKAWGFKYKTNWVWDKERGNYGYYHNNQHELLLHCTRGSCKPDRADRDESVRRHPRLDHSEKPDGWRMLIDFLYPDGPRLELFARGHVQGWDVWGNEALTQS